ncbi:MAG: hypothetical protein ACRDP4_06100 [Nocardioidaceae bacterium]
MATDEEHEPPEAGAESDEEQEPPEADTEPEAGQSDARRLLAKRVGWLALRFAICVVAAAIALLPLALEHGLESTEVHDSIGVVPATFTLTGDSESQLRLGVLGNLYSPASNGVFGIAVTVDGPPSVSSSNPSIASYFSSQMLQVYGGLFHDPGSAIEGYKHELVQALQGEVIENEVVYALVGGVGLFALSLVLRRSIQQRLKDHMGLAIAIAVPVVLVSTSGVGAFQFSQWADAQAVDLDASYSLPSLDGTMAEGTVTDSVVLRLAIESAVPKVEKLVDRQESRTADYVDKATASLASDQGLMDGPRKGEVAIMMQSDMHCSSTMMKLQKKVVSMINHRYGDGTISMLAISGDLTVNGTSAAAGCIKSDAAVADGAPTVAVTGNHDSTITVEQMKDAGMEVLDGHTVEKAGTTVLGTGDPSRTVMFGSTSYRGDATEHSVGEKLYSAAQEDDPQMVLVHEGYAAEAFIDPKIDDMTKFLDGRGSNTEYWDDGIRDLPTSGIFYGHWHRVILPRVVWNSDGSWSLVMELNTSAGAIASPTLSHFSTPWSPPQQTASFPVIFKNSDSGLITGYQMYTFTTDGSTEVTPRVEIGTPDGHPHPPRG